MTAARLQSRAALVLITPLLASGCAPRAEIPALTVDEMSLVLSELAFYPGVTCEELRRDFDVEYLPLVDTPEEIGLTCEEHWLLTDDWNLLRVWYLPMALNRGTVVLSQGSMGAMPCRLFYARMLAHNGWAVVMYEYRGFGGSGGEPAVIACPLPGGNRYTVGWALPAGVAPAARGGFGPHGDEPPRLPPARGPAATG